MPVEILQLEPQSDGDPNRGPPEGWTLVDPPHLYLSKLAEQWQESKNTKTPGIKFYLNKMPAGYRLFERARPGNSKIVDKHLYGHPKGRYFDSPNRFYPHFEHLVENGTNLGCPCTVCNSSSAQALPISHALARPPSGSRGLSQGVKDVTLDDNIRPTVRERSSLTDEEGTPDIINHLLNRLKSGPLDEDIVEPASMDWTASKDVMKKWIDKIKSQASWIPRQGELVLFMRNLPGTQIDYDRSDGTYKAFDETENAFTQLPLWEAGVIAQDANEFLDAADLMEERNGKQRNITYSGFRIEPLPTEGSQTKKGHKYVPLHHIRPFVFWPQFLVGHPQDTWHPTILSGIKVTSSICLIDKHKIRGTWPSADISCTGLYIGSELLCVGDTALLTPSSAEGVHDFLKIDSIKLRLTNLDGANEGEISSANSYNSTILLKGKAATLDSTRAWQATPTRQAIFKGLGGYNEDLFWLHDPEKSMQVPFTCVLGRCYDAEAMMMWFPPSNEEPKSTNVLSYGIEGWKVGRSYSSSIDDRILPGKNWFWGDSRLEVLGLEAFNNVYASYYDDLREEKLEEWKYHSNKRRVGRPPKPEKHPMAKGVARALAVSGSENEGEGHSTEDDKMKKRTFDVAMRDEGEDKKPKPPIQGEKMDLRGGKSQSSSRSSSAVHQSALENFKKPKVVIVLDD